MIILDIDGRYKKIKCCCSSSHPPFFSSIGRHAFRDIPIMGLLDSHFPFPNRMLPLQGRWTHPPGFLRIPTMIMWRQQLLLLLMLLLMLFLVAHAAVSEDKHNQAPVLALPKTISLRDGAAMPRVGLGVALTAEQTYEAVTHAITLVGYTLVDTAAEESYGNEDQVGRALSNYYRNHHHHQETHNNSSNNNNNTNAEEKSIFVTTKLWDSDHGF
jgi:hypothetical protein